MNGGSADVYSLFVDAPIVCRALVLGIVLFLSTCCPEVLVSLRMRNYGNYFKYICLCL